MTERVGQNLGNYQLLRLLGQGGFADVYLGEHIHIKSLAAIKVLYTRLTDELRESFFNEARILAHLTHPHIIRVLEFGLEANSIPYLVMDYASQGTLRQRHPYNTQVPLATVVEYVKQIADGLQYAHDQKLIHRDLKPDNVLIGQKGELLLSDFGVAIVTQTTTRSKTAEKSIIGTMSYMAPEQLQGKPLLASDQYGLGIMVYEWLCGTRPFQGTVIEVFNQHLSVPPAPLRQHVSELLPEVEQVVLTALAKDPGQRFASVKAFATALEQAMSQTNTPTFMSVSPVLATPSPDETFISDRVPTLLMPTMAAGPATPADHDHLVAVIPVTQQSGTGTFFPTIAENHVTTAPELRIDVPPPDQSAPEPHSTSTPPYPIVPEIRAAVPPPVITVSKRDMQGVVNSSRKQPSAKQKLLLVGLILVVILGIFTATLYSWGRISGNSQGITGAQQNGTQGQKLGNDGPGNSGPGNNSSGQNGSTATSTSGGVTGLQGTSTPLPPGVTPTPRLNPTSTPKPNPTSTPKPTPTPPGCTLDTDWSLHPLGGTTGNHLFIVSSYCGGVVYVTPYSPPAYATQIRIKTQGGYYGSWVAFTTGSWSILATKQAAGTGFYLQARNVDSSDPYYTIYGDVKY